MMRKRILVTGASGFIGSHICEALHEAGYEVHALVRPRSSREWLGHAWFKIHVAELDDAGALSLVLKGIFAVIHAAGALIGSSEEELYKTNVQATLVLACEAVKAGVKRFIYISSNAAGGLNSVLAPKKESDPDLPMGPYGRSKKQAEEKLSKLSEKIKIVNLRPVVVYGPRDRHLARLFGLLKNPLVPLLGSKPLYLPIVYVKDVAEAAVRSLEAGVPSGSTYYISDGMPYTMDVIYDFIAHSLGKELRTIRIPIWLAALFIGMMYGSRSREVAFNAQTVREFRYRYRLISNDKAKRELGWNPRVMINEGIPLTVKWYREAGWL